MNGVANGHANGQASGAVDEHEAAAARAEARFAELTEGEDHGYMAWVAERFERLADGARELYVPSLDDADETSGDDALAGAVPEQRAPSVADVARVLSDDAVTAAQILGGIDAADLLALDLPETRVLVPDLVPEGTTLLIAPPKIGKSVLSYQLVTETAVGGVLLGRDVNERRPGRALYLALEDSAKRGQTRVVKALNGRPLPRGRLMMAWEAPPLGGGLEDVLETWLDEGVASGMSDGSGRGELIVVDTLGKARGPGIKGDERRNAYDVDIRTLASVQRLVIDRGVSLVIVHHTKKGVEDDFVASASGTYGIAGSVDTVISLERRRNESTGVLRVTSRSLAESELPVVFRGLDGWFLATEHEAARALLSPEAQAVLDVLLASGGAALTAAAVATALGAGVKRRTVAYHLAQLEDQGLAVRASGGYMAVDGLSWEGPVH